MPAARIQTSLDDLFHAAVDDDAAIATGRFSACASPLALTPPPRFLTSLGITRLTPMPPILAVAPRGRHGLRLHTATFRLVAAASANASAMAFII